MSFRIERLKNVTKYPFIYQTVIETRNFTCNNNLSYYRPDDDDKKDFSVILTRSNKEYLADLTFFIVNVGYVGEINLEQNFIGDLELENQIPNIPIF